MKDHSEFFLKNKSDKLLSPEISEDTVNICEQWITDNLYFDFLNRVGNGGFFFGHSFQLYDQGKEKHFNQILEVNRVLVKEYAELFKDMFSFGQDIFGNQFVFDRATNSISFFNVETASKDHMANTFSEWLDVFVAQLDFYSGRTYEYEWLQKSDLPLTHRLIPKTPFVIGGEFEVNNFLDIPYPDYISRMAYLAKQIVNLPNGAKVKLVQKK